MISILTIIFFLFGLIIGSFLNVVIIRHNTQKAFGGRSVCLSCQRELRSHELVPVLSFFALRGRCSGCQSRISIQYPLVEFLTGLVFAGLFLKFQNIFFDDTLLFTVAYAYYAAMFSLLLVIAVYDLKHKIIPDSMSLIFGALAFIGLFLFADYNSHLGFFIHLPGFLQFLSGILISLPFAVLWFVSEGAWIGLGDAKLAVGLGWLLGLSRALSGLVIAFWSGALVGLVLIAFSKRHSMKSEISFAPFLVWGALLAFLFEVHFFPVF